ncbi:MAG TPA: YbhB/YbcL family Raf kinase inhibitor-like protein [Pyrinomonadaceae bacterium]|jgi:Raf kinase inhibitor-like YbhB/YbcL family protein|nr:YbhB/YbcL family Raf kinase inhibitor-like protein [Pyrinomonadaceae bacterium]
MWNRTAVFVLLLITSVASCRQTLNSSSSTAVSQTPAQAAAASIKLSSSAFKDSGPIPKQYTCDGVNISPPLEWTGIPKTGKTIAIIADDPDAPAGTWVHWIVYNLPAESIGLIENTPATDEIKGGGFQGRNDFKDIGYGGPCPPSGTHRYFFKIYALDSELPLKAGATKAEVENAMAGHIVGQGQLIGTYRK